MAFRTAWSLELVLFNVRKIHVNHHSSGLTKVLPRVSVGVGGITIIMRVLFKAVILQILKIKTLLRREINIKVKVKSCLTQFAVSCAICGDIDSTDFRPANECQSSSANYTQQRIPDGCWVRRHHCSCRPVSVYQATDLYLLVNLQTYICLSTYRLVSVYQPTIL